MSNSSAIKTPNRLKAPLKVVKLPKFRAPKFRLLPTVMMAAAALLVLKSFGIISGDGYVLGPEAAFAQEAPVDEATADAQEGEAGANEAEGANAEQGGEGAAASEAAGEEPTAGSTRPQEALPIGIDTERTILERLAERRKRLNDMEAQLETRLAVLEAAEKRLDERAAELKTLEAQINGLVQSGEEKEKQRLGALVSMYETMKPKDAARIFDQLQLDVLRSLVNQMNPRKMAAVLAKMSSEKAQALTLAIALGQQDQMANNAGNNLDNLPQIVGN